MGSIRQYSIKNVLAVVSFGIIMLALGACKSKTEEIAPTMLQEDRHEPYIQAVSEGLFMPEQAMTRGEASVILYSLMEEPGGEVCHFPDIDPETWCYKSVSALVAVGAVEDSEEPFMPGEGILCGDLLSWLSVFDGAEDNLKELTLSTDRTVTRGLFCRIINIALGRRCDLGVCLTSGVFEEYKDVSRDNIYFADIMEATSVHDFRMEDGVEVWTGVSLEPGFHRSGGRLYYVQESGELLRNGSYEIWDFDENGAYTTGIDQLDEQIAGVFLSYNTDDMTQEQALREMYRFVTHDNSYLAYPRSEYNFDGVHYEYSLRALHFLKTRAGNCYDFAATFGVLAKALGYETYIIMDHMVEDLKGNQFVHGWVVIPENGVDYIYDPELEFVYGDEFGMYSLFRIRDGERYDYKYSPWW